tara:strand:+ start:1570 stop:2808 length:1239 start_codon:yes stop_codon:yes gene_type:complete
MAQYYDPREAATTFSLYANIAQTQRQQEEEESKETLENIALTKEVGGIPLKFLETRRAEHLQEARTLLSQRDQYSATGFKYKPAEYVAPERKRYNPRRLKDWFNARYGRPGEERVELEERTLEGKQLENIKSDPDFRHGIFDPEAYRLEMENKAKHHRLIQGGAERWKAPDPAKGTIARDELTAQTSRETSDIWKGVAETRGREIGIREGMQGQSASGYKPGRPLMQHKSKVKSVIPGGVISEQIGKPLIPEAQGYGDFNELVSARDAAKKGSDIYTSLQGQVNELYKQGGGTYQGAFDAYGATKTASGLKGAADLGATATKTATAVDTGGDIIGATGETAGGISPLTVAMEGKQLYDVYSDYGASSGDKVKATAETGADLASSYAIASGNPYAMGVGLLYKGGKAAWEYLA